MSRMLVLGWRLALGGGREGLVRLIFMAVGVGVGVAIAAARIDGARCAEGQVRPDGLAGRGLLGAESGDG